MAKIPKEVLEALLKESKVGARTAKALHKANGTDDAVTPKKPRGHGAAYEATSLVGEI
jgi:hypothetical protein